MERGFSASLLVLYGVVEDRCAWSDLGRAGIVSRGGKRTASYGWTALPWACKNGHRAVVEYLLTVGAADVICRMRELKMLNTVR